MDRYLPSVVQSVTFCRLLIKWIVFIKLVIFGVHNIVDKYDCWFSCYKNKSEWFDWRKVAVFVQREKPLQVH